MVMEVNGQGTTLSTAVVDIDGVINSFVFKDNNQRLKTRGIGGVASVSRRNLRENFSFMA